MLLLNFGTSIALLIITFLSPSESQLYQNETGLVGQTPPGYKDFINATMDLMAEGEREIILDDACRDIILVVGMTGAGKTTITKFITQIENLESYRKGIQFLIRDKHGDISEESTVVSKTIFPRRIIDNSTLNVFYDMPGFFDTRNVSIELANSWFMKKVADHARRAKIVIVVSHSTLLSGEHRDYILNLLSLVTDYVKDPEKFKDSISLVVSKVQHQRGKPRPIAPGVAAFLKNVKSKLESVADPKKLKSMTDLINVLVSTDANGNYTKIAAFKQPRSKGPLFEMPEMLEQQNDIKRVIFENTKFVDTSPGDFGVSVSSEAINLSSNLTKIVTQKLQAAISSLQEQVQDHFQASINNSSLRSLGNLIQNFRHQEKIPSTLSNSSKENFLETLIASTAKLGLQGAQHDIQEIRSQRESLEFFATITGNDAPSYSRQWNTSLALAIESTRALLQRKLVAANKDFSSICERKSLDIRRSAEDKLKRAGNKEEARDKILALSENITNFVDDTLENAQTYNDFASKFSSFLSQYGLSFEEKMEVDVNLDGAEGNCGSILNVADWLLPFIKFEKHLRSEFSELRFEIHSQRNQKVLSELLSNSTSSQQRLTDQINAMKLRVANFKMVAQHERQMWKDNITQQETRCQAEEQSIDNTHAQKTQHIRDTHAQNVSSLLLEIQQETQSRDAANATRLNRLQELQQSTAEEKRNQDQTIAALEKVSNDGFAQEEKRLQQILNQANMTCLSELDNLERHCQRQLEGQRFATDQEGTKLRLELRELESRCDRDADSKRLSCQRSISALRESNNAELRRSGYEHQSFENTCNANSETKRREHLGHHSRIVSEASQSIRELASNIAAAKRQCELQVQGHNDSQNREIGSLQDGYNGLIRNQLQACEWKAEYESSPQRYSAELRKYRQMAQDSEAQNFH